MRTGAIETDVPDDPDLLWRVHVGSKVSPPIIAEGRVFVSLVDEHHVACLDARSGQAMWGFAAGARIDSPPTYHRGTVVFGSADGWVYCVRADDGQLVWRFCAAPNVRLIGAFGQLESAWPVHGSVLVEDDIAYFAAGRSSQLDGGIYLYGIEATTGKLVHQTKLSGPDYAVDQSGQRLVREQTGVAGESAAEYEDNFQLPMGSLSDILTSDGTAIYMRWLAFDKELRAHKGGPLLRANYGFLEGSYFKRTPWTFAGNQNYARLIVHNKKCIYYVRQFDTLRGLDPTVFFTPGNKGYLLFARDVDGDRDKWAERVPVRVRAMVLAGDYLIVAGPPDVVDPKDPLGAFEGRKGGLMYVLDADSGKKLAERQLSAPPVFNGAAAASGRFYLAHEDGNVTCFGKQ
jgi:outer membrane protein assembly factor BamB